MNSDTALLDRIAEGDRSAVNRLLERYRPRLRRLVDVRIDDRCRGRFDSSDVIQDAFTQAGKCLTTFARDRQAPFYPWLRRIAINRLLDLHRHHLDAHIRTVKREVRIEPELSNASRQMLVKLLADKATLLQQRKDRRELVQQLIERLSPVDREVLVLRYLEQCTNKEAAEILEISENAFAQRHVRALRHVRKLIDQVECDDD